MEIENNAERREVLSFGLRVFAKKIYAKVKIDAQQPDKIPTTKGDVK